MVLLIVCCLFGGKIAFDVMMEEVKVCRVFNGSHGERGQKHKLDMLPVVLQMHDGVQELYRYDTVIDKPGHGFISCRWI